MGRMKTARSARLLPSEISAVILAGGEAVRFGGKSKFNTLIDGETIISRSVGTLRQIFDEIIIVTNSREEFTSFKDCLVTGDLVKGYGPIAGIHAAIKKSSRKAIFAVASDMPFLDEGFIRDQVAWAGDHPADAVIPEINGMREPLHGIYMTRVAGILEKYIIEKKQYSLTGFLDIIDTGYYRFPAGTGVHKFFTNINTEEDAARYNGIS